MTSVDRLARDLAGLRQEVQALATTPRLSRSSIDGGALEIRDIDGNTTGYVGEQFDGTFTVAPVGGSYPASPLMVMVTPVAGGLRIYWDGTYEDGSTTRMDFRRVTLHAVPVPFELDLLSPTQIVGEIASATGGEIIASLPPIPHLVYAVTWTDAGKFSPESEPAFGTPLSVVDQAELDALDAALVAADVRLTAATGTLTTDLSALAVDVAALEAGGGAGNAELSALVTLINNSTRLQHGIY